MEFFGIFVNFDGFKGFVHFLDVGDELVGSLVLANRVDIHTLVVEEERLGVLKILIFLQVVLKNEFEVIERLGVSWGSNGSRFDFFENQIHLGEGELGVSIDTKDIVDDSASDTDVLGDKAATLHFQIVNSESGGVKNIPGVLIWAVLDRDSWCAETSWDISALGVAPVLADLGGVAWRVVVVFSGNNDVVSLAVSDNGFFFGDEVVSLGQGDFREVELKSGGNSPLDVVCPFVNVLVQNDSVSLSRGDFDSEGFLKGLKLFVNLHGVCGRVCVVELSVVGSELDVVHLHVKHVSRVLDVEVSSDVEGGGECDIVVRSSLGPDGDVVNVLLSRSEHVGTYITLYKSAAAEYQTQQND